MATLQLTKREAESEALPNVCMLCGEMADRRVANEFCWYPSWVYLLIVVGIIPFFIISSILGQSMTVKAPMCRKHRWHWTMRDAVVYGGLLVVLGTIFGPVVWPSDPFKPRGVAYYEYSFLAILAVIPLFLVASLAARRTGIRPLEITDRSICLTGVAPSFVEQLEKQPDEIPNAPRSEASIATEERVQSSSGSQARRDL